MEKVLERRKYKRLQAETDSFVFFMAEPGMAGRIIDISKGGLGFNYLASSRRTTRLIDLTLVSIPHNFRSQSISVQVVSDFSISEQVASNGARRCGAKFYRPTKDQEVEIEEFLECCTSGAN